MTRKIGNVVVLAVEKPQQCDGCGEIAELRPYGINGECVCYKCGREREPITTIMMAHLLFGDELTLENIYQHVLKWGMADA